MLTTESNFKELVERVRKLERQNRRWKVTSFLLLLLIASSLATGLVAQVRIEPPLMRAKAMEAQSFVLKDADGTVRGQMNIKAGTPVLELYDKSGKVLWSAPTKTEVIPALGNYRRDSE